MDEDLIAISESTKRQKYIDFYKRNKKKIILFIFFIFIVLLTTLFYINFQKKNKTEISNNFFAATSKLRAGDTTNAKSELVNIIFSNDATYSSLALFLIVDEKLEENNKKILSYFDHVLKNNKYEKEIENLIIYKRLLIISQLGNENQILDDIKPIIKSESLWKPHALILLGDYYFDKKNFFKAKSFYEEVLKISGLKQNLYNYVTQKIKVIGNEN